MENNNDIMLTKWASTVSENDPWPDYPSPQWKRPAWKSLNGLWDYSITKKSKDSMGELSGQIRVPFCIESYLSQVQKPLKPDQRLWYRRKFLLPKDWNLKDNQNVILHFGAVDWKTDVYLNGTQIGSHIGGYMPFSFDITKYLLKENMEQELIVSVWDPTDKGNQERGKQVLRPFGVNYTPCSGIWQTVWLELVNETRLERPIISTDIDTDELFIKFSASNSKSDRLVITVLKDNNIVTSYDGKFSANVTMKISNPKLWTPETPDLYDIHFELYKNGQLCDSVESYTGFRKISLGKDSKGITRICLNNKPLFQYGPLDQGYWPDGIYTAPNLEAMVYDIEIAKKMGFNMIRKHIKVEPELWYYYCDKLGMLVWQDMPSGGSQAAGALTNFLFNKKIQLTFGRKSKSVQDQYYAELKEMVNNLVNHPSIVVWIPFNEGWGQFGKDESVKLIRSIDKSRLINYASGWLDKGYGDIHDIHSYPGPKIPPLEENRAVVLGEFGGIAYQVEGHIWKIKFKWGYKKSKTQKDYEETYKKLMEKLNELVRGGLCAGVYTQITDVEGEINGLITYDRDVIKVPIENLQKYHKSLYN